MAGGRECLAGGVAGGEGFTMSVARLDLGGTCVIVHLDFDYFYVQDDLFILVLNVLVKLLDLILQLGLRFGYMPMVDLDCCSSCG